MKFKLFLLCFILFFLNVNSYSAEVVPKDLNFQGNSVFVLEINCAEGEPSSFKEGNLVEFVVWVCRDLNCFKAKTGVFLFEDDCFVREEFSALTTDGNIGLFLLQKKKQDVGWELQYKAFFSRDPKPVFSETPLPFILPALPPLGFFWLVPIGIAVFAISIFLMRFTQRKIAYPLFIAGAVLIVAGILLS